MSNLFGCYMHSGCGSYMSLGCGSYRPSRRPDIAVYRGWFPQKISTKVKLSSSLCVLGMCRLSFMAFQSF